MLRRKKKYVIAIDFDGTIVTDEFPEIGKDAGAIEVMLKLQEAGHKLILFTMRAFESDVNDDHISSAIEYCESRGINFYGINNNPAQTSWNESPKVYADIYIDDRGILIPTLKDKNNNPYVNWGILNAYFEDNGFYE